MTTGQIVIDNRLTQQEWEYLGNVVSLMDNPVFDDFVKWRIKDMVDKHGAPLIVLNVAELWVRLCGGFPSVSERNRIEFVTGYKRVDDAGGGP